MSQVRPQENTLPALVACSMIVVGATTGHVLISICFAAVMFFSLVLRSQRRTRLLGGVVFLVGVLGFAAGVLFTTGLSLGKDMAMRDVGRELSSIGASAPQV